MLKSYVTVKMKTFHSIIQDFGTVTQSCHFHDYVYIDLPIKSEVHSQIYFF